MELHECQRSVAVLVASAARSDVTRVAVARYVVRLEPVASATADQLAPALGTTLDHYLTGRLD